MFGKCLVVDDVEELLEAVICSCSKIGFVTTGKTSFSEAKTFLEEASDLSLLITDYNLGEGTGLELVALFQAKNPHCWSVVTSGYSKDELLDKKPSINSDKTIFLEKPFSLNDLKSILEEKFST